MVRIFIGFKFSWIFLFIKSSTKILYTTKLSRGGGTFMVREEDGC